MLSRRVPAQLSAGAGGANQAQASAPSPADLIAVAVPGLDRDPLGGAAGCKDEAEETRVPSRQQAQEAMRGEVIAL